jgi:hypothetical protein
VIKFDAVAASICEHHIVMRVPRRVAKSDEAVFLAVGILKAQDCALAEVNLKPLIGHTRRQADFTAQPVNEFKVVAHVETKRPLWLPNPRFKKIYDEILAESPKRPENHRSRAADSWPEWHPDTGSAQRESRVNLGAGGLTREGNRAGA